MMKNLIRCVIVLSVVVVVLTGAYLLLLFAPEQETFEGVIFTSREPIDIEYVEVNNASGSFRFYFDDEDGGYITDDIPPQIVDIERFIHFMTNSAQIAALRTIPLGRDSLQDYGLLTPHATVEIKFVDGEVLKIDIGEMERVSGHFYAAVYGYDDVFIISRVIATQFLLPKTQVISPLVTPPLTVSSPLSAIRDITFAGGGLSQPVTIYATAEADDDIKLAAMSFGATTHIVKGAATYQLDQAYGILILGSLFEITAVDIVGYNLSENEIIELGFDDPYMSIDYTVIYGVDEYEIALRFVEVGDGRYYAMRLGSSTVYLINHKPFLGIEYEKLLLRWFLTPLLKDLDSVTIEYLEESYKIDLDVSDPLNPIAYYDGEALDISVFHAFYRLITSAGHDGAYLGSRQEPRNEQPQLKITYEYLDRNKRPDVMTMYDGGVRRVDVFVNGAGEFAMRDTFVQRVQEGIVNLIAGHPIEENW